jgi:hypothetical protein
MARKEKPVCCPKCKSYFWDTPKTKVEKEEQVESKAPSFPNPEKKK